MNTVKLYYEAQDDLRRIRIEPFETLTFPKLMEHVYQAFPTLRNDMNRHVLYYVDNEGDKVTLSSKEDIMEASRVMQMMGSTLKIIIGVRKEKQDEAKEAKANFEAMLASLQVCLTMWPVSPMYMELKENVLALLNDPKGVNALTDIFAMPEYSHTIVSVLQQMSEDEDITKGLVALRSSGQTEDLASEFLARYPESKDVVHQILSLSKPISDNVEELPTEQTTVQDTQDDFPDLKVLLEVITGSLNPSIDELTMNQAGEVLINLGVHIPVIQPLTLEKRIFLIKELQANRDAPVVQEKVEEEKPNVQETTSEVTNTPDEIITVNDSPNNNEQHTVIGNVESFDEASTEPSNTTEVLDAMFVADITTPDGTSLYPGQYFEKVWLLKNNGTIDWPHGTTLSLVGGDPMCLNETVALPVVVTKPGEEVRLALNLVAPQESRRYIGYWRLTAPDGNRFGHRIWVDIVVVPTDSSAISIPPVPPAVPPTVPKSEPEILADVPMIPVIDTPPSPEPSIYAPQLVELESMGFSDNDRNLHLLQQANGNLQQVINQLLG